MCRIESAAASDRGRRRSDNQDRFLNGQRWFAVADGVGGNAGGDVAAELAVDVLHCLSRRPPSPGDLTMAVQVANAEIHLVGRERPSLRSLATTLTAIEIVQSGTDHEVRVVSVGDSRLYLLRRNRLTQLTSDDAILVPIGLEGSRRRRMLTRALGLEPSIHISTQVHELAEGDRLILCSDGITDELSNEEILDIACGDEPTQSVVEQLVWAAVTAGGRDNATAVVVDLIGSLHPLKRWMSPMNRFAA